MKSTIPRRNKIPDDELFEEQRSPFSATNAAEEINNTVTELRPQNNISNDNANYSDHTGNSIEGLNSILGDKSSANLTMQNTGKFMCNCYKEYCLTLCLFLWYLCRGDLIDFNDIEICC